MIDALGIAQVEAYTYTFDSGEAIVWNVDEAKRLIARRRVDIIDVPREELAVIKARNEWSPPRVAQVDPTIPGIGAPILFDGNIGYILIDGTHRCVRALELDIPFKVALLTDEDSRAAIVATRGGGERRIP